jgi:hypothetical protein
VPSFYRTTWRLELEGFEEPLEVTTSARDSLHIVVPVANGEPQFALGINLEIIHNALMRLKVEGIPRDFLKFADLVLDTTEVDEAAGTNGSGSLDPTLAALSDT